MRGIRSRVAGPIPAFRRVSHQAFVIFLFTLVIAAFVLPDLYFNWRELTRPRARGN